MNLGDKILKLRKDNKLSQEQLWEKINVTRQTISNWELGVTSPNPEQLKLLSEELNISIDELLENKIKSNENKSNVEKDNNIFYSIIKYIGIFFSDIIVGAGFILLYAWLLVMILFSMVVFVTAGCLVFNINIGELIPFMPYWCGIIVAIALILLSALFVFGSILYSSILKKLLYSYINIHRSIMGNKTKKTMKKDDDKSILRNKMILIYIKLVSIGFILVFILSLIVCMISAGNLAFWHTWNWWV